VRVGVRTEDVGVERLVQGVAWEKMLLQIPLAQAG